MTLAEAPPEKHRKRRRSGYTRGPVGKGARVPVQASSQRSVTDKVKRLVEAMVCQGMTVPKAALAAGISDSAAYQALMKPDVIRYLNEQVEVFRRGARASSIAVVAEIRDDRSESGKTRIEAAKYLDGQELQAAKIQVNVGVNVHPGYHLLPASATQQMLQLAGSSASILDYQEDSESRSDTEASERVIEGQAESESGDQ